MLFCPLFAVGQNGNYYNVDKHLSSSFVNQIYQDNRGFIWIATRNGLNRYDGYNFRIYKKGMPGCDGLASNIINCITQTDDNIILVGMFGGAQALYQDRFYDIDLLDEYGNSIRDYVTSIIQCTDRSILIGTSGNGIFRLVVSLKDFSDKKQAKLKAHKYTVYTYTKDKNGKTRRKPLKEEGVKSLFQSSDGSLWVLTDTRGLLLVNGKKTRHIFSTGDNNSSIMSICEDRRSNVYIATHGNGLYFMKPWQKEPQHIAETGNEQIQTAYVRSDGKILIGLDGNGIEIYDPRTHTITRNPYYHKEFNLARSKVHSIIEDRNGNMWFGLYQKGVFMQPHSSMKFNYMGYKQGSQNKIGDCCVMSVCFAHDNSLWIGTDKDGIYHADQKMNITSHINPANMPSTILSICDMNGTLCMGSYLQGAGQFNGATFSHIDTKQEYPYSVFSIDYDKNGDLWLATMGQGLLRYSPRNGSVEHIRQNDALAGSDSLADVLGNGYIYDVTVSKDCKRLYTATTMGLCCYDIENKSWTKTFGRNILLWGTPIRTVCEITAADRRNGRKGKTGKTGDDDVEIWFGTNDGLYIYNINTRKLMHMTVADGLSSEGIAAIQSDKRGAVWVSTIHGLNRIDATTRKVTNRYYVEDGLQGNEFSDGAAALSADGTLVFGGVSGITYFTPTAFNGKTWRANILLTDFKVNGRSITAGEKSGRYVITDVTPIMSDKFDLYSEDNNITLQFSTMTYEACEHITYHYRINSKAWIELPAGTNEISLSHLPAGDYKFTVYAEKDGQRSAEKTVRVCIHSPWYATAWAYSLYLLAVVAGIVYFLNNRRLRLRQQMRQKMEAMERAHAEELHEAKIRFFMNISHEIRTPITLIKSPITSLIEDDDDPQRLSLYHTIRRNADRILNLINQLMDLRKIEKEQMPLRLEPTDMVAFINEIYQLFSYQAKAKSMRFSFIHTMPVLMASVDRSSMDKILVNLISNSFKFTPPGGEISITLEGDNDTMRITVWDNGPGIPPEKLDDIFCRFYSNNSIYDKRFDMGTGIGLDLTRQLVLLHHGTIQAENNADKGCHFTILIPRGDTASPASTGIETHDAKVDDTSATTATTMADADTAGTTAPTPRMEEDVVQEPAAMPDAKDITTEAETEAPHTEVTDKEVVDTGRRNIAEEDKGNAATAVGEQEPGEEGETATTRENNATGDNAAHVKAGDGKKPKAGTRRTGQRKRKSSADQEEKPAPRRRTAKERIAIVEDDDDTREYLANELSAHFAVTTYTNGKDALAGILLHVPSLVVSDIMMPEMDGITLCSRLKTNINTNHIPVILLTAKDTEEDRMSGIGMGADAYISKPFNLDILRHTVLNLLASRNVMKVKFTGNESHEDEIETISMQSADDKLMKRIIAIINKNLSNSDLTVDDIAQEVGLSRVHLYRKMKELTNQSPHQFIRNIRVRQAARLLKSGRYKVSEIMYACGFPNATAFNNGFKAVYGISPREYMKKM